MIGFPVLLVIVVVVSVVLAIIFARPSSGAAQAASKSGVPSCGNCGYGTRGIAALTCPECGADLRVVGIVKPGEGRSPLTGCLMPLLITALMFLLAVGGGMLASLVVPNYEQQSTHFDIWPESDGYAEVLFRTEMMLIIPASDRDQRYSFDIRSNPNQPYTTTVDYGGGPNARVEIESIALEVRPLPTPSAPNITTFAPSFRVNPQTRIATWSDAQGNTQTSNGPVKDKHLLAYFAVQNIDTSRPDVVSEVQQLTAMIDGLIAGNNQFTLQGFDSGGYGSGSTASIGPPWLIGVYILAWIVIWIVVMIVMAKRARRKS